MISATILCHLLLETADNLADETSLDAIGLDHAVACRIVKMCIRLPRDKALNNGREKTTYM